MPETTPLIKAALNLRVGAGFDVYILTVRNGGKLKNIKVAGLLSISRFAILLF